MGPRIDPWGAQHVSEAEEERFSKAYVETPVGQVRPEPV